MRICARGGTRTRFVFEANTCPSLGLTFALHSKVIFAQLCIMAAEDDLGGEEAGGPTLDGGPGLVYMPYVLMENLLDKLKLLNYDEVRLSIFLET